MILSQKICFIMLCSSLFALALCEDNLLSKKQLSRSFAMSTDQKKFNFEDFFQEAQKSFAISVESGIEQYKAFNEAIRGKEKSLAVKSLQEEFRSRSDDYNRKTRRAQLVPYKKKCKLEFIPDDFSDNKNLELYVKYDADGDCSVTAQEYIEYTVNYHFDNTNKKSNNPTEDTKENRHIYEQYFYVYFFGLSPSVTEVDLRKNYMHNAVVTFKDIRCLQYYIFTKNKTLPRTICKLRNQEIDEGKSPEIDKRPYTDEETAGIELYEQMKDANGLVTFASVKDFFQKKRGEKLGEDEITLLEETFKKMVYRHRVYPLKNMPEKYIKENPYIFPEELVAFIFLNPTNKFFGLEKIRKYMGQIIVDIVPETNEESESTPEKDELTDEQLFALFDKDGDENIYLQDVTDDDGNVHKDEFFIDSGPLDKVFSEGEEKKKLDIVKQNRQVYIDYGILTNPMDIEKFKNLMINPAVTGHIDLKKLRNYHDY